MNDPHNSCFKWKISLNLTEIQLSRYDIELLAKKLDMIMKFNSSLSMKRLLTCTIPNNLAVTEKL